MNFKESKPVIVELHELVEQMEPLDNFITYLNIRTGEYVVINEDYLRIVGDIEDLEDLSAYRDFEKEEIMNILDIQENFEDYRALPTKFDLDEYSIMEDFIETLQNRKIADRLEEAIIGKGAFRRFKDNISSLGLTDSWFNFRDQAFLEIAKSWCEEWNLAYRIGKAEIDV